MMTSESNDTKLYSEKIRENIKDAPLCMSEDGWIQFIQDHRKLIIENSTYTPMTEEIMVKFEYRLNDYLDDIGNNPSLAQVTKIVNRLGCDLDFNSKVKGLYIPNISYIQDLRHIYSTVKAKRKKL